MSIENKLSSRYGGIVIKGMKKDLPLPDLLEVLKKFGLPKNYSTEELRPVVNCVVISRKYFIIIQS